MALLREKKIFVIGPLKAQNRLMTLFLERETGARCTTVKDFHAFQLAVDTDEGHQSLVLWDCFGKDMEGFLSEFSTEVQEIFAQHCVALFNVIPCLGIEKEAFNRGARGVFCLEEGLEVLKQGVHAILKGEL